MPKLPEMSRLHRYFYWLGIYWGAWSVVLFLFNPIGDVLDTYGEGFRASLCERLNTNGYWELLRFHSVQLLVVLHSPILALFACLRHRWAAFGGVGCALAYLLFMFSISLDRWLADDLFPAATVTALCRAIAAVLWCAPAVLLMLRLENLRRVGIHYQRDFFDPRTAFAFEGRVVNFRLVWWCSTCFRLMPWLWLLIGMLLIGAMPFEIRETGIEYVHKQLHVFVAFTSAFTLLGGIAILLAIMTFFQRYGVVLTAFWLTFLTVSIITFTALLCFTQYPKYYFLENQMAVFGWVLGIIVSFTAMLAVAFYCIKLAGLPPSIRVSDLTEVERAEIAGPRSTHDRSDSVSSS